MFADSFSKGAFDKAAYRDVPESINPLLKEGGTAQAVTGDCRNKLKLSPAQQTEQKMFCSAVATAANTCSNLKILFYPPAELRWISE